MERGASHAPHSLVVRITYNNLQRLLLPQERGPPLTLCPGPQGQCPEQSRCSVTCQFILGTMLRGSLLLKQVNRRGESSEPVWLGRGGGDWGVEGLMGHQVKAGTRPSPFQTAGPAFPASHGLPCALFEASFWAPVIWLPDLPPSALH